MTFYDDYSNTPDKQYAVGYNGLLDAGTNQHAETVISYRILLIGSIAVVIVKGHRQGNEVGSRWQGIIHYRQGIGKAVAPGAAGHDLCGEVHHIRRIKPIIECDQVLRLPVPIGQSIH